MKSPNISQYGHLVNNPLQFIRYIFLISFICFFIPAINLLAQGQLFTYIEEPDLITDDQEEIIERFERSERLLNTYFIDVEDLYSIEDSGEITVLLPDKISEYAFNARYVEGGTTNYQWYGEMEGHDDSTSINFGYLTYISNDGQKFGFFEFDTIHYEIHDLGDGLNILLEFEYDSTLCGVFDDLDSEIDNGHESYLNHPIKPRSCGGLKKIDILVLWTREGANDITSGNSIAKDVVENTIRTAISMGNNDLRNSSIANNEVFFNLVGSEEVAFTPSSSIFDDLLEVIQDQTNQQAIDIRALREAYDADIVMLLVETSYSDFAGLVSNTGNAGNGEHAYGIVQSIYALQNQTLIHEMCHLFGCLHQPCSLGNDDGCDDGLPAIAHGYHFQYYKTIMDVTRRKTLPNFSNPNVIYKNHRTGIASTNYNAQQIKNEACDVSEYRGEIGFLVGIGLHSNDCSSNQQRVVEANITGGGPNFTYSWHTSINGFQYTSSIGSSSSQSITIPSGLHGLFVKLIVTSGSLSYTAVRYLRPCSTVITPFSAPNITTILDDANEFISLEVYPNPVDNLNAVVKIKLEKDIFGKLELLNINGTHFDDIKEGLFKAGTQEIKLDFNLQSQIYLLRFTGEKSNKVIKFIKL